MKKKRNNVLKSTLSAIEIATMIFCIIGIIFDVINKGNFKMMDYSYTKMAAGMIGIGIGFGIPTFAYDNEKISLAVATLIHMGTGCVVMTVIAFIVGWIPTEQGALPAVVTVLGEIGMAFVIWLFFYSHQKRMAKTMNNKISQLNQ